MIDMIIMMDMVNNDVDALNNIVIILTACNGMMDRMTMAYEIGRALGTAKLALGSRINEHAKQAVADEHARVMAAVR